MFTAIVLICAGGIESPDTCYTQVNEMLFNSYKECKTNINDTVLTYPELFEWYDATTGVQFKITDWRCIDWSSIRV